ncbi:sigma-70 family RNA polymerase sigma factor [Paraliomyxa miuraensis]|uniref:sigma-70 family RNA polymerase sigma factor n=1 Tax=Paraliomyxa miuraensis TaxID=376150 RepID=UPI00225B4F67|nr:sigma-70 family RNA polymerase sigma factor [Paraliomyxa miuraensis]MCX4244348.1 sigma-70 family RNA polymerase sigma factor [Paraliomyxa miuraensis]
MTASLRQAFVTALDESVREAHATHAELDEALEAMAHAAVEARGPLGVSSEELVAHVARVAGTKTDPGSLASLRAGDLYLACACASPAGRDRALALFDAEYGRDIDLAIARSGNVNLGKDEFRQLLRDKLFVPRGERPPKIADYAGRGDLRSWVRVTALRMIVDIVRSKNAGKEISVETEMLGAMPAPNEDPELDYIQRVYKSEFKDALQSAFGSLTPRERNLLRHQVIHGLNIDQVGAIYRVHRTTAFRWIEKARKSLLRETRAALMSRLRVGSGEFLSIMRVVQGDLDVSMRRLLVSEIEAEPGSASRDD